MPSNNAFFRARRLHPGAWLQRHAQTAIAALGRLWERPLGSGMTILVIAVALALPFSFRLLVENVRQVAQQWEEGASVSVYLKQKAQLAEITRMRTELARVQGIEKVTLITPEQGLAMFRQIGGFGEALDLLDENPLPYVLVLHIHPQYAQSDYLYKLQGRLRGWPLVQEVKFDLEWIQRLHGIAAVLSRMIVVLGGLLIVAVTLIVGNTIRLDIQSRKEEIQVVKLVGGTAAFIRRPFLYEGFWHGLLGGLLAWVLSGLALSALAEPWARLGVLYEGQWAWHGPGWRESLGLVGMSIGLGIVGAWVAVSHQLATIEPS